MDRPLFDLCAFRVRIINVIYTTSKKEEFGGFCSSSLLFRKTMTFDFIEGKKKFFFFF